MASERESIEYDVVIIGAGPAGLSAAIRIKQLAGDDISVAVLEKAAEVGGHIISGAILDPIGLNKLFPDWAEKGAPITTPVKEDSFYMLGPAGQLKIPNFIMPPLMHNHGNFIVSMANVCRWLAEQAEALGVEIFPGMACAQIVYGAAGEVKGVVAGEFGMTASGEAGANYEPGMEVHGKYVLFSEGARGSLSKQLIENYQLDKESDHPKFGLGMKEIWEIDSAKHTEGKVVHSLGWPLDRHTGGGFFIYHLENNQVYLGGIIDLNYKNPHLFPYMEFQRWKHHPLVADLLENGKRVAYGARVVTKGGPQSIPKVVFSGGALLGCSAGLTNLPRIKGNHNAMLSGIAAAEAAVTALQAGRQSDELTDYETELRSGLVAKDLEKVKNVAPLASRFGTYIGSLLLGGIDMWCASLFKFHPFGTLSHTCSDADATGKAEDYPKIDYPKPDNVLSFDRLTNVAFTGTAHEEDQPCHLKLSDASIPTRINLPEYDEPAQRYCPAGVYEIVYGEDGADPRFQINAQNCIHCKTCDIKDPLQNITWTTPQGGEGPNYPNM